jgi:hypothetical protein
MQTNYTVINHHPNYSRMTLRTLWRDFDAQFIERILNTHETLEVRTFETDIHDVCDIETDEILFSGTKRQCDEFISKHDDVLNYTT